MQDMPKNKVVVIVHDVRSNENVGSIFRTSDAAGVSTVYLTGYTPAPLDRFGRVNKALAKAALGAEQYIEWHQEESIDVLIKKLKKQGTQVIAIEQDTRAQDYKEIDIKGSVAFVLGNEVDGLPKKILKLCDDIAEIPMKGKKESLNVAVAFGIAVFRMLKI